MSQISRAEILKRLSEKDRRLAIFDEIMCGQFYVRVEDGKYHRVDPENVTIDKDAVYLPDTGSEPWILKEEETQ